MIPTKIDNLLSVKEVSDFLSITDGLKTPIGPEGETVYEEDSGFSISKDLGRLQFTIENLNEALVTKLTNIANSFFNNTESWNGTSWSNGVPSITTTTYITGNYSESTNLLSCTLTVSSNAIVAIPSGTNVTLNGKLIVEPGSNFTLNSNSNLIQQTLAINTGDITVKRMSSPVYRLDYTLWSSPVSGSQTLFNFSPLTIT